MGLALAVDGLASGALNLIVGRKAWLGVESVCCD